MDISYQHDTVVLADPGQVIMAVPHFLGFHPTHSIVVVSLDENDMIRACNRADIPHADAYASMASRFATLVAAQKAAGAVIVVVADTETTSDGDLPYRDLVDHCVAELACIGVQITGVTWTPAATAGSPWCCYDTECVGTVPDSAHSSLIQIGQPIRVLRADLVDTLAPDDDDLLARRAQLLVGAPSSSVPVAERLRLVEGAIERAVAGDLPESDDEIVALAKALTDPAIRDACVVQPDPAHTAAAERLWTALVRGTPAPERAESACLLGFSAYSRGDGILAGIALAVAYEADPRHRLTDLLRGALWFAVPPDRVQAAGLRATAQARGEIAATEGR